MEWGVNTKHRKGQRALGRPQTSTEQTSFWGSLALGAGEFSWVDIPHRKEQTPSKMWTLGFILEKVELYVGWHL